MRSRSPTKQSRSKRASHAKPRGQAALPGFEFKKKLAFGGSQSRGNPKTARPVVTNQALHITLRSTHARGRGSFLYQARSVERILRRQAEIFGIRLYDFANAGNHLHLLLRTPTRRALQGFLRAVSGLIARLVLGCEKGAPWRVDLEYEGLAPKREKFASGRRSPGPARMQFWDARPHSRIVSWGPDYNDVKNYLEVNRLETKGFDRLTARDLLAEVKHRTQASRLRAFGFS